MFANVVTAYCDGATEFLTFGYIDTPLSSPHGDSCIVEHESLKAIPAVRLALPLRDFQHVMQMLQKHMTRINDYYPTTQDKR